jgi:hypothetical protein
MNPFPPEIWLHIVEKHLRKYWLVLSTTCSPFRILAQASLYHTVSIEDPEIVEWSEVRMIVPRFSGSLAARPELGHLVRDLTLWSEYPWMTVTICISIDTPIIPSSVNMRPSPVFRHCDLKAFTSMLISIPLFPSKSYSGVF